MKKYCLIIASFISALLNANGVKIDNLYYLLDEENHMATVTYTLDTVPTKEKPSNYHDSIVIPAKVTYSNVDYTVTEIGEKAFFSSYVVAVEIPNTVNKIGANAFSWSFQLLRMDIPGNVKEIGSSAFVRCDNLAEVYLEEGVEVIGNQAFQNCYKLATFNFPTTLRRIGSHNFTATQISSVTLNSSQTLRINEYAFFLAQKIKNLVINCPVVLDSHTFEACDKLDSVDFGTKMRTIGPCMFRFCAGMKHINIPDNITSIESYGFDGCTGLQSVNLPSTLTSIGTVAFRDCSSLTKIHFPDSLSSIGKGAFRGATHLKEIRLPAKNYKVVEAYTFEKAPLIALSLPETMESIGTHAFLGDSLPFVYCGAITPPELDTAAFIFTNTDKTQIDSLLVPIESLDLYLNSDWTKYFKHIRGGTFGGSTVEEITTHSAQIKWIPDSLGIVAQYEIDVYHSLTLIAHYEVDAQGKLMAPSIARMRRDTTSGTDEYYVLTITGLDEGTSYNYTITGTSILHTPVYRDEGSFTTAREQEGIFDIIADDPDKPRKILYKDQIYILRGDKVYTLTGQAENQHEIKQLINTQK